MEHKMLLSPEETCEVLVIRQSAAEPDNPGVDSAKVPANQKTCWQGLSPVTPGVRRLRREEKSPRQS